MTTCLRVVQQFHPDLHEFLDRVRRAGGSLPEYGVSAHNRFINRLIDNGLWGKMKSTNGFILTFGTASFNGLFVPLVAPIGVAPTSTNFVSADYSPRTGLNPGTANLTKYIDSGWVPSVQVSSTANFQLSVYARTNLDNATGGNQFPVEAGSESAVDSAVKLHIFLNTNGSSNSFFDYGDARTSPGRINSAVGSGLGLTSGVRRSATRADVYQNGVSAFSSTSTLTGTTPPNNNLFIMGMNSFGTPSGWGRRIHSYFYCGNGLTAVEEAIHYRAVQELQLAYGRSV